MTNDTTDSKVIRLTARQAVSFEDWLATRCRGQVALDFKELQAQAEADLGFAIPRGSLWNTRRRLGIKTHFTGSVPADQPAPEPLPPCQIRIVAQHLAVLYDQLGLTIPTEIESIVQAGRAART